MKDYENQLDANQAYRDQFSKHQEIHAELSRKIRALEKELQGVHSQQTEMKKNMIVNPFKKGSSSSS